jgi:hypothetical protein
MDTGLSIMGHYDEMYEADAEKHAKEEKVRAKTQLRLMEQFRQTLHTTVGIDGIKQRHLDAFDDMINATKVRAYE